MHQRQSALAYGTRMSILLEYIGHKETGQVDGSWMAQQTGENEQIEYLIMVGEVCGVGDTKLLSIQVALKEGLEQITLQRNKSGNCVIVRARNGQHATELDTGQFAPQTY